MSKADSSRDLTKTGKHVIRGLQIKNCCVALFSGTDPKMDRWVGGRRNGALLGTRIDLDRESLANVSKD